MSTKLLDISEEQLLIQLEKILRSLPSEHDISALTPENYAWQGEAKNLIALWDLSKSIFFDIALEQMHSASDYRSRQAYRKVCVILNQAIASLRLKTYGPMTVPIERGKVFDYFDEIRKLVESAKSELFVIDPYLNTDFLSSYMPYITKGISVRLLASNYAAQLMPAIALSDKQHEISTVLRKSKSIHDRYIFIDRQRCYQSGASLKDGGKNSHTTLTQITDAFSSMMSAYESIWNLAEECNLS